MNNTVPPESEFLLLTFFFFFDVDDRRPLQKSSPGPHRPPETDHCTSADQTLDWCELQPLGCGVGVQTSEPAEKDRPPKNSRVLQEILPKKKQKTKSGEQTGFSLCPEGGSSEWWQVDEV